VDLNGSKKLKGEKPGKTSVICSPWFLYSRNDLLKGAEIDEGRDKNHNCSRQDPKDHELPDKFEAGTPNIAGIVGFGEAIKYLEKIGFDEIKKHIYDLTFYALDKMRKIDGLEIYGPLDERHLGIENLKEIFPESILIVDGAQLIPHEKIDVKKLGIDFLVFSAHKMLGPSGVGLLYGREEYLEAMEPFLYGGEMIDKVSFDNSTFNQPLEIVF